MNNIENRIKRLENKYALPPTLQEKLDAFSRSCAGLPDNVVAERKKQFKYRLSDKELLEIVGLGPNPTEAQLIAVANHIPVEIVRMWKE